MQARTVGYGRLPLDLQAHWQTAFAKLVHQVNPVHKLGVVLLLADQPKLEPT